MTLHDENRSFRIPLKVIEEDCMEGPKGPSVQASSPESMTLQERKEQDVSYRERVDPKERQNERIEELEKKLEEAEDRWKRTASELDNFRKRFDRELKRLREIDRKVLLRAFLPIADNLERALEAEGSTDYPLYRGIEGIYKQMCDILEGFGVRPFEAKNEPFDPTKHEAISVVDRPDEPERKIVEVLESGYLIGNQVLRPAKVIPVKHSSR